MNTIRTMIVDDEPLARKRLLRLLKSHPDLEVVAECKNGDEAVDAVTMRRPDLVFLDIQMPGLDGFEVIEKLAVGKMPAIVFVTAHAQHAIQAFEVDALDYLLKPIDATRLEKSVQRVRERLSQGQNESLDVYARLLDAIEHSQGRPKWLTRVLVTSQKRSILLRTDRIHWIEAAGKYARLHCEKSSFLLRKSMAELESSLDPDRFLRIHRSAIVNLDFVKEFQPFFHGELRAILLNGAALPVSRRMKSRLKQ